MYPLTNLATTFNKESIDKIGNTFWQKDLMTVVTINKKPLKGAAMSQLFIATATLFCKKVLFLVSVLNF